MSPPAPNSGIGLKLFVDRRKQLTAVQENSGDAFIVQVPLRHGSVRIECEGGLLFDGDVRPGLMRVLAPGERVRLVRRSAAEGAALTIPAPLFRRIAEEQGFTSTGGLSLVDPVIEADPRIERLGWLLGSAADVDPQQRALFVEGVTLAILAIAFGRRRGIPEMPPEGLTDAQMTACREYARSRISERLDLGSWARAIGMTPSEFTRRFRRRTNASPYACFLQWRIDHAKLLLAHPGATLAGVALDVGFSSQSHFSETFRRHVGLSPGRWRREALS